MKNLTVDSIIENLFQVLPIIHKKLLRMDFESINSELSRIHLPIMRMLAESKIPMSEIARRLVIPRPHMTRLIDQLEELGIVERQPDISDRRITNITLTDTGRETLKRCEELVRNNLRLRLSSLTESELEGLATSLEKIKEIGTRLE